MSDDYQRIFINSETTKPLNFMFNIPCIMDQFIKK
jgi:hypothetical protein